MRYSISGDFYRVMRITGPRHNLLGLSFAETEPETVALERLGPAPEQSIDEGSLTRAVLSGVEAANAAWARLTTSCASNTLEQTHRHPNRTPASQGALWSRIAAGGPYDRD